MQIDVYSGSLTRLRTELLVVACFEDVRPLRGFASEIDWFYNGVFSRMLMQHHFSGALGKTLLIPTVGKLYIPRVILAGLGKVSEYDDVQLNRAAKMLFHTIEGLNIYECAVGIETVSGRDFDMTRLATSFLNGWKSESGNASIRLTLVVNEREQAKVLQHQINNGDVFRMESPVHFT